VQAVLGRVEKKRKNVYLVFYSRIIKTIGYDL
jgi:hypothetical protein